MGSGTQSDSASEIWRSPWPWMLGQSQRWKCKTMWTLTRVYFGVVRLFLPFFFECFTSALTFYKLPCPNTSYWVCDRNDWGVIDCNYAALQPLTDNLPTFLGTKLEIDFLFHGRFYAPNWTETAADWTVPILQTWPVQWHCTWFASRMPSPSDCQIDLSCHLKRKWS